MSLARTVTIAILVFAFGCLGNSAASHAQMGSLLKRPEVRKELRLSDAKYEKVVKIVDDRKASFAARMKKLATSRSDFAAMSKDQRNKVKRDAETIMQESIAIEDQKVEALLDARQAKRLKEIQLQHLGIASIKLKTVAGQLGLSKDQIGRVEEISNEHEITCTTVRNEMKRQVATPEYLKEFESKLLELQKKRDQALVDVLAADQKGKWKELQGEKFEFAARQAQTMERPKQSAERKRNRAGRDFVKVEIRGKLTAAKGSDGEVTKFEIVVGDIRWELDLTGGGRAPARQAEAMREMAIRLDEQTVMIEGRLVMRDGESEHLVVIVESFTSVVSGR